MIRVAALGDIHAGEDSAGTVAPHLASLPECADFLLVAGDLTRAGRVEEAEVLARELEQVDVPIVAVLGNHDYHAHSEKEITAVLEDAGVRVLEGGNTVLELGESRVGVAGVKGFGGGFAGACGTEFGEPEMKSFMHHTKALAQSLEEALADLRADVRIALTHYAPIKSTLVGEKLEIYPFLGSYLLGEAIDVAGADLAVHGHAHAGTEKGVTPGGVHVRNVAQPVLKRAYALYCFSGESEIGCEPAAG